MKRNGKSRKSGPRFEKRSKRGGWQRVSGGRSSGGSKGKAAGRGAERRDRSEVRTGIRGTAASPQKKHGESMPKFAKKSAAAKLVQSLQDKKTRNERRLFLVEGETSVLDALQSGFLPETLFATHGFLGDYPEVQAHFAKSIHIVDEAELTHMGTLAANKSVIGVFKQRELPPLVIGSEIAVALAGVNDPGNLGTIIRIADWYGIKKIIASHDTVDAYHPRVVSATKGSFARVDVYYQNLDEFLGRNDSIPVYAADMRGEDVHVIDFPSRGILLLGNETHGIPEDLHDVITKYVTIPRFGGAESLNVAVAGAVILDNWFR